MTLIGAWIAFWFIVLKLMTLGAFFPVAGGMRTMRVPLQRNVIDAFQSLTYNGANAVPQTDGIYIPYSCYVTAVRIIGTQSSVPSTDFGVIHEMRMGNDQTPYVGTNVFYQGAVDTWGQATSRVVTVYETPAFRKAYIMRTSEDRVFCERKMRKKAGKDTVIRLHTTIFPLDAVVATSGTFEFSWEVDLVIGSYSFDGADLEPPRLYSFIRTTQSTGGTTSLSHNIPVPCRGYFTDMRLYCLNATGTEYGSIFVDKNLQDWDLIADTDSDIYVRRKPAMEIPFITDLSTVYEASTLYSMKKIYVEKTDNMTILISNPATDTLYILFEATFVPFVGEQFIVRRVGQDMSSITTSTNYSVSSRDIYSLVHSRLVGIKGEYYVTNATVTNGKLKLRSFTPRGYVQQSEISNILGESAVTQSNQSGYHLATRQDVIEIPWNIAAANEAHNRPFAFQMNIPCMANHRFSWDLETNVGSVPTTFVLDIEFVFIIEDRFKFKGGDFMEGYLLRNYNTEVVS